MQPEDAEAQGRSFIDRLANGLAILGLVGLSAVALAVLTDVMLRWLMNRPIHGLEDVTPLILAVVVASFMPVANIKRAHPKFELFNHLISKRTAAAIQVLGAIWLCAMFFLITWQVWRYAGEVHASSKTTLVIGLPVAPAWACVAALMTIATIVQLAILLREARALMQPAREA